MRFWSLLQITLNFQYKLRQLYHKLRQEVITNYDTLKIRCIQNLLSITAAQTSPTYWWLLQIAFIFIINYGSLQNYYKLRQKILQITAGITKCGVITNCVVTSLCKKHRYENDFIEIRILYFIAFIRQMMAISFCSLSCIILHLMQIDLYLIVFHKSFSLEE